MDRTNIGVTPLMSTPMSTSYLAAGIPQTTVGPTQILDQGFTIPDATQGLVQPETTFTTGQTLTIPDAGTTTYLDPTQQTTTAIPQASIQQEYATTSVGATQVLPTQTYGTTTLGGTAVTTQPYTVSSVGATLPLQGYGTTTLGGTPLPVPAPEQKPSPVGPIMDEDFQRGRPIYDEFTEDRYRGFRFGH